MKTLPRGKEMSSTDSNHTSIYSERQANIQTSNQLYLRNTTGTGTSNTYMRLIDFSLTH